MPIKIFSAPGDHLDDYAHVENQSNEWIEATKPDIKAINTTVNQLPTKRDTGQFMLTLVIHYEKGGG